MPKMAFKFVESTVNNKLQELEEAKMRILTEQGSRLKDATGGMSGNDLHPLVNKLLAQSLAKIRMVTAEMDRHRST